MRFHLNIVVNIAVLEELLQLLLCWLCHCQIILKHNSCNAQYANSVCNIMGLLEMD